MPDAHILSFLGGDPALTVSVLVFLAATLVAFLALALVRVRADVRRRAGSLAGSSVALGSDGDPRSLRHASLRAARWMVDYTTRHYGTTDETGMRTLRRQLVQAGFLDPRAPALFFLARAVLAVGFGVAAFVLLPVLAPDHADQVWLSLLGTGIAGYVAPTLYVGRRIKARQREHMAGFPDFMDLLVVCADAGLSMEAALDRVGRELHDSYPSLSANIYMATLEIRAGKAMSQALEHFGDRLGIEEARSFATLLQQSEKLGSSITDALRVYSDDMRHKRLSRAEEKAYSLPSKLTVPMMLFVFPIVLIVIILPVYVKFATGSF